MTVPMDGPRRDSRIERAMGGSSKYRRVGWGAFDLGDDLLRFRVKARLIDMCLVLAPAAALELALALFWRMIGEDPWGSPKYFDFSDMGLVFAYFYLTCVFLPILPAAILILEVVVVRKNGQTLGKQQTGICVRHIGEDGVLSVPTVGRAVARAAVLYVPAAVVATAAFGLHSNEVPGSLAVLSAIPAYVLVATLPVLFTPQRRGLHDLIARTVVVVVSAALAHDQPSRETAGPHSVARSLRVRFRLGLAFRDLWKPQR